MSKTYYEIGHTGIRELVESRFMNVCDEKNKVYLMDLQIENRSELYEELKGFDIKEDCLESAQNPSEHIRFETIEDVTYGELAYFRKEHKPPIDYIGIIARDNLLILIYRGSEELSEEITREISLAIKNKQAEINVGFIIYILFHEILTNYGQLILSYREDIEDFARDFKEKSTGVNPGEFLDSKSLLSDFSRVFEKLYFTLNFPPVKGIVDKDSLYQAYFKDLLKTVEILKQSLSKAEERLNSLHDHYLLTLQDKSNKRINFLTVIQAIFVPLTLLAGIYGMNFQFMPELEYKYAYFISLAAMLLIAIGFVRYFRKHGWFD